MGTKKQKAYRARQRAIVIALGPGDIGSMQAHCFYGSKGDKPASERRPHHGGKVACRLTHAQKLNRLRTLIRKQEKPVQECPICGGLLQDNQCSDCAFAPVRCAGDMP